MRCVSRFWLIGVCLIAAGCVPNEYCYEERRSMFAGQDACDITSLTIDPFVILDFADVVSFALANNRDLLTQSYEWFSQREGIREQCLKQLPSINLNGHWEERNNRLISSSQSITPQPPAPPSISSNRQTKQWDITPLVSILDFGLAYLQSEQEVHKAHALYYKHQRARETLILDITKAYYRTVTFRCLLDKIRVLVSDINARRETLNNQANENVISEFLSKQRQDRMLEALVQYRAVESEYNVALSELISLMGLPPGTCISLKPCEILPLELPQIDMEELEMSALCKRMELFQQDAQQLYDVEEVRIAILRMVPGAQLFSGYNYDGNTFLLYNHWLNIGIRASYDLLTMPSRTHAYRKARYRVQFDTHTRLALSIGVMAQVYLARVGLTDTFEQYQLTQEWADVRAGLAHMAKGLLDMGQFTLDDVIDRRIDAMEAEILAMRAYSSARIALEQLANSAGQPLMFQPVEVRDRALYYGGAFPVCDDAIVYEEAVVETVIASLLRISRCCFVTSVRM